MAIRLLRESSEIPNITNKDDVRMIRYAYGGYDGVVQKYGEELAGTVDVGSFRIGSGRVVLHGWEVEIDGAGWVLDVSNMTSGTYYYTVYLEINAELETAEIKHLYDTASYPEIDLGDDLTESQSGLARMALYSLTVSNGRVTKFNEKVIKIPKYGGKDFCAANAQMLSLPIPSVLENKSFAALPAGYYYIEAHTISWVFYWPAPEPAGRGWRSPSVVDITKNYVANTYMTIFDDGSIELHNYIRYFDGDFFSNDITSNYPIKITMLGEVV